MDVRTKVVQLIPGLIVGDLGGGLELYSIRLAQALDPSQFQVQVVNLWRFNRSIEQKWEAELRSSGIEVHYGAPFDSRMSLSVYMAWHRLRSQLALLKPDIVHAHGEYAGIVGMALRLTSVRTRLIRTCHTTLEFPRHPSLRLVTSALYPLLASAQVGVSANIVTGLERQKLVQIRRQPVWLIPNGIDLERTLSQRTEANLREELGLSPNALLFGLVGRLTEQKGIPDALQAFAQLRSQLPNALLVIVGSGYGAKPQVLQAQATALGLDQSVLWLGAREDVINIIASLDVLVSSSLWEGLPTVILEAMALGTPVVATDIPGTRDLIIHEQTGLLVPPRQPSALAQAMVRLACDRDLAARLAAAARTRATQFTVESAARQYEQLYRLLMSRNSE